MRARDHYTEATFGKRYHPYIIYKYIAFLRIRAVLPAAEPTSACPVCLGRAADESQAGKRMMSGSEPGHG